MLTKGSAASGKDPPVLRRLRRVYSEVGGPAAKVVDEHLDCSCDITHIELDFLDGTDHHEEVLERCSQLIRRHIQPKLVSRRNSQQTFLVFEVARDAVLQPFKALKVGHRVQLAQLRTNLLLMLLRAFAVAARFGLARLSVARKAARFSSLFSAEREILL
ncbi:unnamed protein product, partial [Sphagnum balticum]